MEQWISAEFERLINAALADLTDVRPEPSTFDHQGATKRSLDAALLAQAARRRGVAVSRLSEQTQIFTGTDRTLGFFQNMPWSLSAVDRYLTNDKELTKQVLRAQGLPVARGEVVTTVEDALTCLPGLDGPAVVKPIVGSNGRGIAVGVQSEPELQAAMRDALSRTQRVLVEECVISIDLRIAVVGGHSVAAMMRVPANVLGDGVSTVAQLIDQKNAHRAANAYHKFVPITVTAGTEAQLARYGLRLDSVPQPGFRAFLHYKANLSAGGDSIDLTDRIHPGFLRLAEAALGCFRSADHGGIDILAERFDQPPEAQRAIICEINCNNDLPIHVFPLFGKSIDVADLEVAAYFPPASRRSRWRTGAGVRPWRKLHRATTTAAAPWVTTGDWPDLPRLVDPPRHYPDPPSARSPRRLDLPPLRERLTAHGWTEVRAAGKLLHARHDDRQIVVERSGRAVFPGAIARRPETLYQLLRRAGLPACRTTRLRPDQLDRVARFQDAAAGPWLVRAGDGGRTDEWWCADPERLRRVLADLPDRSTPVIIQQAPDRLALRLLLVRGELAGTLLHIPPGLAGDGTTTVAALVQQKLAARAAHPYLRHFPVPEPVLSADALAAVGLAGSAVPPPESWILLGRSPSPEAGGETVGLPSCPAAGLVDLAGEAVRRVGAPPVAAVTFAARPAPASREWRWAIAGVDPDPVLAEFAWPWAGAAPGDRIYPAVAEVLRTAQRYQLPPKL
jgi:D-alanine-D-alanine ligase-like ATP-grasp enzyme